MKVKYEDIKIYEFVCILKLLQTISGNFANYCAFWLLHSIKHNPIFLKRKFFIVFSVNVDPRHSLLLIILSCLRDNFYKYRTKSNFFGKAGKNNFALLLCTDRFIKSKNVM